MLDEINWLKIDAAFVGMREKLRHVPVRDGSSGSAFVARLHPVRYACAVNAADTSDSGRTPELLDDA
jgi:hypothetical protein